jgi:hypothetical protein
LLPQRTANAIDLLTLDPVEDLMSIVADFVKSAGGTVNDLNKGGPGSGPHPGPNSDRAVDAHSIEEHKYAASYHQGRADYHADKAQDAADEGNEHLQHLHERAAQAHDSAATSHRMASNATGDTVSQGIADRNASAGSSAAETATNRANAVQLRSK